MISTLVELLGHLLKRLTGFLLHFWKYIIKWLRNRFYPYGFSPKIGRESNSPLTYRMWSVFSLKEQQIINRSQSITSFDHLLPIKPDSKNTSIEIRISLAT